MSISRWSELVSVSNILCAAGRRLRMLHYGEARHFSEVATRASWSPIRRASSCSDDRLQKWRQLDDKFRSGFLRCLVQLDNVYPVRPQSFNSEALPKFRGSWLGFKLLMEMELLPMGKRFACIRLSKWLHKSFVVTQLSYSTEDVDCLTCSQLFITTFTSNHRVVFRSLLSLALYIFFNKFMYVDRTVKLFNPERQDLPAFQSLVPSTYIRL